MASETLVLDPTSEDSTNTQLTITDPSNGIDLLEQSYPMPDRDRQFAASVDTIGDPLVSTRFKNRVVTLKVRCYGASMRTRLTELENKVGKFTQYGGTLKRTLADSSVIVFDVLDADLDVPADWHFLQASSVTCTVTLTCKPLGRGAASTYGSSTESSNPELVFTVAAPSGNVPALGLLEVTEAQGVDQGFVQWGVQSRNYGTATTAALAFSGSSRLAYNGSTALAVSGAVGGTVLNQGSLTANYQAVCSLASSGTAYPTHVGSFGVWARLYMGTANAGTVTAALEWAQGDLLNYTRNDGTVLPSTRSGAFLHTYLGQVRIERALTGAQRWDGRLVAKSTTSGDDLAVDRFYLFPVDEGYGEARSAAPNLGAAPTAYVAQDGFDQAAGALTGKTLPVGGTWAGAGDADDFSTTGSGAITRTAVSDSSGLQNGRLMIAGSSTYATCVAGVSATWTGFAIFPRANGLLWGVLLRYVDTSNFLAAYLYYDGAQVWTYISKRVAGVTTALGADVTIYSAGLIEGDVVASAYASGDAYMTLNGAPVLAVSDPVLATGGALATGKVGFFDNYTSATALTRTYDNFWATATPSDAALYASRKLQVRDNTVIRQDSTGTAYGKPGDVRGDYLRIPASNTGGTARVIVKASRGVPETGIDGGVDDITGQLTVTPLYLAVP